MGATGDRTDFEVADFVFEAFFFGMRRVCTTGVGRIGLMRELLSNRTFLVRIREVEEDSIAGDRTFLGWVLEVAGAAGATKATAAGAVPFSVVGAPVKLKTISVKDMFVVTVGSNMGFGAAQRLNISAHSFISPSM
jgi:hypothetical protein